MDQIGQIGSVCVRVGNGLKVNQGSMKCQKMTKTGQHYLWMAPKNVPTLVGELWFNIVGAYHFLLWSNAEHLVIIPGKPQNSFNCIYVNTKSNLVKKFLILLFLWILISFTQLVCVACRTTNIDRVLTLKNGGGR